MRQLRCTDVPVLLAIPELDSFRLPRKVNHAAS
jgi:hypothetical protein